MATLALEESGAVEAAAPERAWESPTWGGYVLFILGLSLFFSALKSVRPMIAGLSVHPYLLVLVVAAPFALFVPHPVPVRRSLDGCGIALMLGITLSFFGNGQIGNSTHHLLKWATMGLTFMTVSRLVRTSRDATLGVIGTVIGVVLIAVRGVILHELEPRYYLDLMPGIGSRNVFSLWTLAPLAYSAWLVGSRSTKRGLKLFLMLCLLVMAVPQILSLSRSGWLLVATTTVLVLGLRRSLSSMVVIALVALFLQVGVAELGFREKMEERFQDLEEGTRSDVARREAIKAGLIVFARNPLLGVSEYRLPYEISREMGGPKLSSHNLFIAMLGGTGLAGTLPLLLCMLVIVRRWRGALAVGSGPATEYAAAIPILLILIALRGMTANEILYNPSVIIGVALGFGAANHAIGESRLRDAAQSEQIRRLFQGREGASEALLRS